MMVALMALLFTMGGGKAENDNLRSGQAHHATSSTEIVTESTVAKLPIDYEKENSLSAGRGGEGGDAATGSEVAEESAQEDLAEVRYYFVLTKRERAVL